MKKDYNVVCVCCHKVINITETIQRAKKEAFDDIIKIIDDRIKECKEAYEESHFESIAVNLDMIIQELKKQAKKVRK